MSAPDHDEVLGGGMHGEGVRTSTPRLVGRNTASDRPAGCVGSWLCRACGAGNYPSAPTCSRCAPTTIVPAPEPADTDRIEQLIDDLATACGIDRDRAIELIRRALTEEVDPLRDLLDGRRRRRIASDGVLLDRVRSRRRQTDRHRRVALGWGR